MHNEQIQIVKENTSCHHSCSRKRTVGVLEGSGAIKATEISLVFYQEKASHPLIQFQRVYRSAQGLRNTPTLRPGRLH